MDDVYRRHEEFFGLHDVAERLLDFDERVHLFRFHHLKLAQRIIGGGVVGTMGTPVEVLHQRMGHLFYKDLWDIRNQITARGKREPCSRKPARPRSTEGLPLLGGLFIIEKQSGSNSVVECDLAKVEVAGSNPVSRSRNSAPAKGLLYCAGGVSCALY